MTTSAFIECRSLSRVYSAGGQPFHALRGIDLQVARGELVAVVGASGSGKSSLLNAIGGLDQPSGGEVLIDGQSLTSMPEPRLADLRNRSIGFIYQQFNLLPRYDGLRNVELPLVYAGWNRRQRRERALSLIRQLGLVDHASKRPTEMSGGQQQRLAIARALVNDPTLLLADEPTGALDSTTGADVMKLLVGLNRESGITLMIVTHDIGVAAQCDRTITFADGRIVEDHAHPHEAWL